MTNPEPDSVESIRTLAAMYPAAFAIAAAANSRSGLALRRLAIRVGDFSCNEAGKSAQKLAPRRGLTFNKARPRFGNNLVESKSKFSFSAFFHVAAEETIRAQGIIQRTNPEAFEEHQPSSVPFEVSAVAMN